MTGSFDNLPRAVLGAVDALSSARLLVVDEAPSGFQYMLLGGDVVISHHGRRAITLRRAAAAQFLADVESGDPQELMARLTGNYKHGNERTARNHPRNGGR